MMFWWIMSFALLAAEVEELTMGLNKILKEFNLKQNVFIISPIN